MSSRTAPPSLLSIPRIIEIQCTFDGAVDKLRTYNRPLTDGETAAMLVQPYANAVDGSVAATLDDEDLILPNSPLA